MKKFLIIIIIFLLIGGCIGGYFMVSKKMEESRIEKIKEGWYVEVLNETVKIRKEANRNSSILSEAKKGDVYAVSKYERMGSNFWYYIEYEDEKYGWIANPANSEYLNDVNNPEDIMSPTLKFFDTIYYANSIDEITYDHLEVKDDRPGVEVTHKIYHEVDETEGKDQYWIQYTATDQAGKSTSKVQKIVFNIRPDESRVYPFSELER